MGNIGEFCQKTKRIETAKLAKTTPASIDRKNGTGIFPGRGSVPYQTTLDSYTCGVFLHRKLPCKHIYRLAIEVGLLHEEAKRGINKNILDAAQFSLREAVDEIEKLSDDCQLFAKDLLQTESAIFLRIKMMPNCFRAKF